MNAAAPPRASPARSSPASLRTIFVAAACLCPAAPAAAEVGASVSIFSDSRFRGYSLSAGHPVAIFDLSYDNPDGLYGALSASAVLGSEDVAVRPLGLQLNAGYAKRLSSSVTLDAGIVHSNYSEYSSRPSSGYTEVYAGVTRKALTARVAYSPHYFEDGAQTFYGELDGNFSPARKLRLSGHVGVLIPIAYPGEDFRTQHDWRLGAAREVGRLTLHALLSGGGPGRDYYGGHAHHRTALILGLSCPF